MSRHKCNRDDCHRRNVDGPKIKCAKCKNVCYLGCFNICPAEGKNDTEIVKISFVNGFVVYTPLSQLAFVCCDDSLPSTELKSAMKQATKRSTSNTRQVKQNEKSEQLLSSELDYIKSLLEDIAKSSSNQSIELRELKSLTNETNVAMKKVTESSSDLHELISIANETNAAMKKVTESSNENATMFITPRPSNQLKSGSTAHKPSFAQTLKTGAPLQSSKRRRTDNAKSVPPKPKLGKKFDAPKGWHQDVIQWTISRRQTNYRTYRKTIIFEGSLDLPSQTRNNK